MRVLMIAATALALLGHAALAETPDPAAAETVSWAISVHQEIPAKPASALTLTLQARVKDGWHVYALNQLPGGPTPLRITVDPNNVAAASGEPVGSTPAKIHDRSFDLDTQLYSHAFSATVPVRIAVHSATGRQLIPVSVRFQTCNDRICQPPKTIHLSAPVTILPGT